jgi:hypothetical protein
MDTLSTETPIRYEIGSSRIIYKTSYIKIFFISISLIIIVLFIIHNVSLNRVSDVENVIYLDNNINKEVLQEKIVERSPIIINNMIIQDDLLYELKPEELRDGNPDYLINYLNQTMTFADFIKSNGYIINNGNFIDDFKMRYRVERLLYGFDINIHCSKRYDFNLHLSKRKLSLNYNNNNVCSILQLNGEQTINLFHPNYSDKIRKLGIDIWSSTTDQINENLKDTKFLEIRLLAGQILYIPPLWFWCNIVSENCVYVKYTCDSYFTYFMNKIK